LVRNLTIIHYARVKGTTFSLSMIITDKKQVDMQWYIITVIGNPSLHTSKLILFYLGISALETIGLVYIWTAQE
jgi:hypothetical protein